MDQKAQRLSQDLHDLPPGFQVPPKREFSAADRTREAMHALAYGIHVIGSSRDGDPNAMIADWVMQVSFEPRLIAVALENDSPLWPTSATARPSR